ncbi:hypothetical protein P9G84_31010 [Brevibacillus centrosporus]|uniref:hypothetical protein n=1 Tax=Brevibacillus centrosporus TaxID=54910 RepID=UPI001141DD2D|nr:hypothetical protein [Brevibacillus centrosporus]MEC2133287.1 hypothetical protein [Brevibacillus centrosporus]GED34469.1 hypothetical protein BCE02nite_56100 [Brevibacillus centrosporus]
MKRTLESIVGQLTNYELKKAFDELVEFRNTGVLVKDGIVRAVHADFEGSNSINFPISSIEGYILFEFCKRTYGLLPEEN